MNHANFEQPSEGEAARATSQRTDWNPHLRNEFERPYWSELQAFVRLLVAARVRVLDLLGASGPNTSCFRRRIRCSQHFTGHHFHTLAS